jgi:uncharacterized membrane protein
VKRNPASLLLVVAIILVGYGLLTWDLDANSVWTDEEATLDVVSQPTLAAFFDDMATREGRPPLYYLLLRGWIAISGHSDFSVRYLSVLSSVVGISLAFALGHALLGHIGGLLTALLTITAPYYILYGRMIRAYPLTVVVGLASCFFFVLLLKRDRPCRWVGYGLASIALMYTDYFVFALLAAQNFTWLATLGWRRLSWKKWGLTQALLVIVFAPWVPSVIGQGIKYSGEADFAYGLSGYAVKTLYPFYSFAIGETIFPWHLAALIGVPLVLGLALWGYVVFYRRDRIAFFFTALAFAIPLLFTIFVVSTWLVPVLPFVTFGSRMMFAGPLLYLPVAAGLLDLRRPPWPVLLLAVVCTRTFALDNYYNNRDFHNAIYIVPTREIAAIVTTRAQPGDIVVANSNIPLDYYYTGSAPLFYFEQSGEIQAYIEQASPVRVWVINYERDRSTAVNPLGTFVASIQDEYTLVESNNYVPQDPLYARVKVALLNHAGYEYKSSLFLYVRADEQEGHLSTPHTQRGGFGVQAAFAAPIVGLLSGFRTLAEGRTPA